MNKCIPDRKNITIRAFDKPIRAIDKPISENFSPNIRPENMVSFHP